MVFQLGFPAGLAALAIIVPLVVIYLRRPKAMSRSIPSLMFFTEHHGRLRSSSLFRKFVRNILFLVQLLALTLLAFSCSQPQVTTQRLAFLDNTILVLDNSASMTPVFSSMVAQARRNVGASTSIVLGSSPVSVPLESGSPTSALSIISQLRPTDEPSDLDSAFLQALAIADRTPHSSRIVVITDRRSHLSSSLVDLAHEKGDAATLVDVGTTMTGDVGFTDEQVTATSVTATVRNFGNASRNVTIDGPSKRIALELQPRSVQQVSFPITQGAYTLTITPADSFPFDDKLYVSNTARAHLRALIVSTNESTLPIERALRAINTTNISITKNRLGTIEGSYDLIVMSDYSTNLILPSFYSEARSLVENGAILVIGKNPKASQIPASVMPVVIHGQLSGVQQVSSLGSQLAESVDFPSVGSPLDATPRNGTISIARAGTSDVITLMPIGNGASMYYGYDDLKDSFPGTPYYPIFWSNVVDELTGSAAVSSFNVHTGDVRTFPQPVSVTYPDGRTSVESRIVFDRAGFYKVGNLTFAANLLDQAESDPSYKLAPFGGSSSGNHRVSVSVDLASFIAVLVLILVFAELYITKKRGEL